MRHSPSDRERNILTILKKYDGKSLVDISQIAAHIALATDRGSYTTILNAESITTSLFANGATIGSAFGAGIEEGGLPC